MTTITQYTKKKIVSDNFLEIARIVDRAESENSKVHITENENNQFVALIETETGGVDPTPVTKESYIDQSLSKAIYSAVFGSPRLFTLSNGELAMSLWNGDIVKRDLYWENDKDCCIFNASEVLNLPKSFNSLSFMLSDKRVLTFYENSATGVKKVYLSDLNNQNKYVFDKEIPLGPDFYNTGYIYQSGIEKRVYYFYFIQETLKNGFLVFDDDIDAFQEYDFLPYYDDLNYYRQMAQNQIIVQDNTPGSSDHYYMMHPKSPFTCGFDAVLQAKENELMDVYAVNFELVYAVSTRGKIIVFEDTGPTHGYLEINREKSSLDSGDGIVPQSYILGICDNKLWLFVTTTQQIASFDLERKETKYYTINSNGKGIWYPVVISNNRLESPYGPLVFNEDTMTFKMNYSDDKLKEWFPEAFV